MRTKGSTEWPPSPLESFPATANGAVWYEGFISSCECKKSEGDILRGIEFLQGFRSMGKKAYFKPY